jgi:hypothetical protein
MLGASTQTVLRGRPAQSTADELSERLGVDVVVQGPNLEIEPHLRGPERRCRGRAEGKAKLQSLTRPESGYVEDRHVLVGERAGRAARLRADEKAATTSGRSSAAVKPAIAFASRAGIREVSSTVVH